MAVMTKQWLQAIAYDDFHEDMFGMPDDKNKQNIKKLREELT